MKRSSPVVAVAWDAWLVVPEARNASRPVAAAVAGDCDAAPVAVKRSRADPDAEGLAWLGAPVPMNRAAPAPLADGAAWLAAPDA